MEIWECAFCGTDLEGTLVIPAKLTAITPFAFANTKLTGLDLSKATSLSWRSGRWPSMTLALRARS